MHCGRLGVVFGVIFCLLCDIALYTGSMFSARCFLFLRRRGLFLLLTLFLLVGLFLFPAFAQNGTEESGIGNEILGTLSNLFTAIIGVLISGFEYVLLLFQHLFIYIVRFTIFDFGGYWSGDGGEFGALKFMWQILRDFVNLVVVVLFILISMLSVFGEFSYRRKVLAGLLLTAVLVNFSAFVTLFLFDISHAVFGLLYNSADFNTFSSLSPLDGYDVILFNVASHGFGILFGFINIIVLMFVSAGLIYFSIILVERFIIAIFLVLLSPLAMLGFFTEKFGGGGGLTQPFTSFYSKWAERLRYTCLTPVLLMLGFILVLALFRSVVGDDADPTNFSKFVGMGIETTDGKNLLVRLLFASIVLIFGVFEVGKRAQSANIHSSIAGKFKFGEVLTKGFNTIAKSFVTGRFAVGAFKNTIGKTDAWKNRRPSRVARTFRAGGAVLKGVSDAYQGKEGKFTSKANKEEMEAYEERMNLQAEEKDQEARKDLQESLVREALSSGDVDVISSLVKKPGKGEGNPPISEAEWLAAVQTKDQNNKHDFSIFRNASQNFNTSPDALQYVFDNLKDFNTSQQDTLLSHVANNTSTSNELLQHLWKKGATPNIKSAAWATMNKKTQKREKDIATSKKAVDKRKKADESAARKKTASRKRSAPNQGNRGGGGGQGGNSGGSGSGQQGGSG